MAHSSGLGPRDRARASDSSSRFSRRAPNQRAGTLSGGDQQTLAIGRVLMSWPKVLLMDEPTMGLAPQIVEQILDRILEIRRLGTTNMNAVEAIRLSVSVYVSRLGEIVHRGRGSDIDESLLKALYLDHDL